jgi:hypothetical protein
MWFLQTSRQTKKQNRHDHRGKACGYKANAHKENYQNSRLSPRFPLSFY